MVIVELFDHEMTFLTLSITLNDHHIHAINQNRIWNRIISISLNLAVFPFYDPEMTFLAPLMTSGDLEMYPIEFKTKFAIDPYVYHVHLAIFPIFDPKVTFLTP